MKVPAGSASRRARTRRAAAARRAGSSDSIATMIVPKTRARDSSACRSLTDGVSGGSRYDMSPWSGSRAAIGTEAIPTSSADQRITVRRRVAKRAQRAPNVRSV